MELSTFSFLLLGVGLRKKYRLRHGRTLLLLLMVAPIVASISSCGGTQSHGTSVTPKTHTMTITGVMGKITQTVTVNLVVTL